MFTFNNAEYKVVARTTNDFGEVAEIAVNNNGELALRQFTYTQWVNLLTLQSNCLIRARQPYSSREISPYFLITL